MNAETAHAIVTGVSRVKMPEEKVVLQPDEDGVIRAKLLSGIEIEVENGNVTYQRDDLKVRVTGGVNFDDLEIIDKETMKVRQKLTPRQRLEFFSRITVDTIDFEEVIIES